jgi:hypothetical protein
MKFLLSGAKTAIHIFFHPTLKDMKDVIFSCALLPCKFLGFFECYLGDIVETRTLLRNEIVRGDSSLSLQAHFCLSSEA